MIIKEGNSTIAIRLVDGEDIIESLKTVCKNYNVDSAIIQSGVGMFKSMEIAFWNGKEYVTKSIEKLVEIISLNGNISTVDGSGEIVVHIHAALGLDDYSIIGGHLISGKVFNGEIFIKKLHNITLLRKKEESGLSGLFPA